MIKIRVIWKHAKYNILYFGVPTFISVFCGIAFIVWLLNCSFSHLYELLGLLLIIPIFLLWNKNKPFIRTVRFCQSAHDNIYAVVRDWLYSVLKYGPARTGKTLTGVMEGLLTSEVLYIKLCRLYNRMSKLAVLDEYKEDEVFMTRWIEVQRSYLHWEMHPERIPCFMSNIKVYYEGRKSQDFYRAHFEQKMWSPSYVVWFCDELDRWVTLSESAVENKPLELTDTVCWIGQFYECHFIATAQRPTAVPVDIRDVIAEYEQIDCFEKTLQPLLLLRIISWLENFAVKHDMSPYIFQFIDKLDNLAKKIGFFEFNISKQGNITYGSEAQKGTRTDVFFSSMDFKYDSRAYYNLNRAKDLPDENTCVEELILSPDSPFAKMIHSRYDVMNEKNEIKELEREVKLGKLKLEKDKLEHNQKAFEEKQNKTK